MRPRNEEVYAFVEEVGNAKFIEFLVPFIDVIAEIFQAFLEQCVNTEDKAVEVATNPKEYRINMATRRVRRKLRRKSDEYRGKSRLEQKKIAFGVVTDLIDAANEQPEKIAAAYRSQ